MSTVFFHSIGTSEHLTILSQNFKKVHSILLRDDVYKLHYSEVRGDVLRPLHDTNTSIIIIVLYDNVAITKKSIITDNKK